MEITYFGHSSFKIKGKSAVVVTDPFEPGSIGLKFPKHIEADIVTVSHTHPDHSATKEVEGSPYVLHSPGEYEIKGIGVVGIASFHDNTNGSERGKNTIFRYELEGISLVHLGDVGHVLSSSQVDDLDGVNILFIPVGGMSTINAAQAVQIVRDIEPDIVVPMHYGRPELDQKTYGQLSPVANFLKEIGKETVIPQAKLSITKDKIPAEMQVVVLE